MKIGVLREGKVPIDRRVPLTPEQCIEIFGHYPKIKIIVQPSGKRVIMDEEYEEKGILLDDDVSDCDILLGIKEVPVDELIPEKTYMFFSHTTKKQEHNKKLLKAILDKKIRLIDYEYLRGPQGKRLIGFGHWAGLIGTYNGFRALCIRNKMPEPKPVHNCEKLKNVLKQATKINLPPVKIAVTGNGRVAHGAIELLEHMKIKKVSVKEYLETERFNVPVYVHIDVDEYNVHKEGKAFDFSDFFANPANYKGNFARFAKQTDMLVMAAYWDPKAPVLMTKEEMKAEDFRIKVIADITCDINGAIPSTLRSSIIQDPFYGYNPFTEKEELAFVSPKNISIMAVDNLPCELPYDASVDFGNNLINHVLPYLIKGDSEGVIANATIAENGKLTEGFKYLEDWVNS
ncbi:MAG: hypothetical protein JXA77_05305 [Bacteroidales bacterium]|nr:hypothetical protein [Bacteroidales bacterium]MBN2818939.1 hypothetical protein [Bacteroidales bacterium]